MHFPFHSQHYDLGGVVEGRGIGGQRALARGRITGAVLGHGDELLDGEVAVGTEFLQRAEVVGTGKEEGVVHGDQPAAVGQERADLVDESPRFGDEVDRAVMEMIKKKAKYYEYQRKLVFNYLYVTI